MKACSVLLWLAALTSVLPAQQAAWQIGPFTRPARGNPVLRPDASSTFTDPNTHLPVHWEALHAFNPAAIVREGKVFVLYRAEDDSGAMAIGGHTSRLGLAQSDDGITFKRLPQPVFYPDNDDQHAREWPGGVEDPRLVEAPDGTYVLTYTQWNRITYSVGVATSRDLIHWRKHGPAFGTAAPLGTLQYKSAGIVTETKHERLIAARIHGLFYMYWGEGTVQLATSKDLIHWAPVANSDAVLRPRAGHFDSSFPEVGPPPVLTPAGIVVLYNGKNAPNAGDPDLGLNAYAAGEALFDGHDPAHLLQQTEAPVLKPEEAYEKSGQYTAGTTFAEGLILFKGRWLLYYGCADSFVGVVSAPALKSTGR